MVTGSNYRVQLPGSGKYLRVNDNGSREWVDNIADATTWPTAGEAKEAADSVRMVRHG